MQYQVSGTAGGVFTFVGSPMFSATINSTAAIELLTNINFLSGLHFFRFTR